MSASIHNLKMMIPCPIGGLEGRVYYTENHSQENEKTCEGMVICPPHPLLAGNMQNNIVQAIVNKVSPSMPVVIFNYRAVGESAHPEANIPMFEYWNSLDERNNFQEIIEDTAAVFSWSQNLFRSFHIVGYSFGAYIALKAASGNFLSLTTISPPLAEHSFLDLMQFPKPVLSIFAEKDTLLQNNSLEENLSMKTTTVAEADHFFIGKEHEVADLVLSAALTVSN